MDVARTRRRPVRPNSRLERSLAEAGQVPVAGLDEVGRGAWAGPVSVGVVLYPTGRKPPKGLCDSKMLSEPQREALYPLVTAWCDDWSVGHASPMECDRLGMTAALRLAARRALETLGRPPGVLLMDGNFDYVTDPEGSSAVGPAVSTVGPAASTGPTGPTASTGPTVPAVAAVAVPEVRTVVRGDAACVSIAAASIVAKVTRDRIMRSMSESFPAFDFDRNKGYPSPVHRTALAGFGLTSLHRRTWSYVDNLAFR